MTMYLEHFGLREAPFKITPHTEFFFAGSKRGETLDALIYSITAGEGIVKVVGEVGSGKTMLCRVLMERLPQTVETIYLAVPSLSRDEMIVVIAGDLGIETQGALTTKLLRGLQQKLIQIHSEGRQVVALVDEAHAMPLETLEEIRLLSNLETSQHKLMQIVLFGQPELDLHLSMPNMRQLKDRITHAFNLLPLPPRDIKDYLSFRLRAAGYKGPDLFGDEALKLIAEASEGLTRRINIYADKTLLAAFAAGTHTVTADHVRAAISDTQITPPRKTSNRLRYAALAAMLVIGVAGGFLAGRLSVPDMPPALKATVVAKAADTSSASGPITPASARSPDTTSAKAGESTVAAATQASDAHSPGATTPVESTATAAQSQPVVPAPPTKQQPAPAMHAPAAAAGPAPSPIDQVARPVAPAAQAPAAKLALALTPPPVPGGGILAPARSTEVPVWLAARFEADRARLESANPDHWSIQLLTSDLSEHAAIENYLREAQRFLRPEDMVVFPSGANGTRAGVAYGKFATRTEAQNAIAALPQRISQFRPYTRTFGAIRGEIRIARP